MRMKIKSTNDINEFAKGLKIIILPNILTKLSLPDLWRDIAYTKLMLLNKRIEYGVRMLVNAYRDDHINPVTNMSEDQLWIRSMYLESAIETYNKVVDYVYSIIYFRFNLDSLEILKRKDVIKYSSNRYVKHNEINSWLESNNSTSHFKSLLGKYIECTNSNKQNANDLKHWGCFNVKGLEIQALDLKYFVKGKEINYHEIINGNPLDIDFEIENLVTIHNETIKLIEELYNICFRADKWR